MNINASSVWDNCLSFIKDNIQPQAFKTWFLPIKPVKLNGNVLSIEVPSKFFYEWLEEHYVKLLKTALYKELGNEARLIYSIRMENTLGNKTPFTESIPSSNRSGLLPQDVDAPLHSNTSELKNPFVIPGIKNLQIESQLNPNYNFDNFLEGDSNRLARSAALAVANKPGGTSFNPLLIFGGVGLGKTHLAHAIGVEIKEKYQDKTVLYIAAEKFTQQYIEAVKKNTRNDFIHFYQLLDVLIIDDVQFLSGKTGTQDVFFTSSITYIKMASRLYLLLIKLQLTCKILSKDYCLDSNGVFQQNYNYQITKHEYQSLRTNYLEMVLV